MLIPLLIMLESVLIFIFGKMSLLHRESADEDQNLLPSDIPDCD